MNETVAALRPARTRRVALLGAGYIADWHAQALKSVAGVELVAVCDQAQSKAEALATRFGVPSVYGSLATMLEGEKLDAVHVLTPPDRHHQTARAVIDAGVGVFLEKPMCTRVEDCNDLLQHANACGVRLGIGHNFLFAPIYEQLRQAVRSGRLGRIDQVTVSWRRPLPQALFGPFDIWMLRDPRNILLEIGSHPLSCVLDLVGEPAWRRANAFNAITLPTGRRFYRHWAMDGEVGATAVDVRLSFAPGFSEFAIDVRGSIAAAAVDFDRNTFVLREPKPKDPDFEIYSIVTGQARAMRAQARATLGAYIRSKVGLTRRGNPYGQSIARALDAYYGDKALDPRLEGTLGARIITIGQQLGALAQLPSAELGEPPSVAFPGPASPRILVLGGSGFIGRELLRQLILSGHEVRALVRSAAAIPLELKQSGKLELVRGDIANRQDLLRALAGIETVFHLARANVKSWADYQRLEIAATERVAEVALEANIKRFIYTGTIDSYYAGARAGVITEATPLDPGIERRNLYARAKAASEVLLMRMHKERGLPLVIVRPGVVIGRGGSPYHWGVGMWRHDGVCEVWGEGSNPLALTLVQDVAAGLILCMSTQNIEGRSFNLIGDATLTAREYLDELDRAAGIRIEQRYTSIAHFYGGDLVKWIVKTLVRHPERRVPSWRDWEGRTQKARFDCTAAKTVLGWKPCADRTELIHLGIDEPVREFVL